MNATNINLEIQSLHSFFSLINQKHNPFSSGVNYTDIQVTAKKLLNEINSKGTKYLGIEYDNSVELLDIKELQQNLSIEFLRDITQAIIEYDMTPNQSIKLGKFIKINFRDVHGIIKKLKI